MSTASTAEDEDHVAVLVCGGMVVDCIVAPSDVTQRGASRTSMPGKAQVSSGGVARNIAETLARLGGTPRLLSAVGDDEPGARLLAASNALGVNVEAVARLPGNRTATYTALLDGSGELVGAVADMAVFDEVDPAIIERAAASFRGAGLVVCDGNLQSATLEQVLKQSAALSAPAWFEPVSVAKAERGRCSLPWHLVSPNYDELMALLGRASEAVPLPAQGWELMVGKALDEAASAGLADHVLLSLGPRGAVLSCNGGAEPPLPAGGRDMALDISALLWGVGGAPKSVPPLIVHVERLPSSHGCRLWYRLRHPLDSVRDVTGAGDSLVAGAARAFAAGWPLEEAVVVGLFMAHLTLHVEGAVVPLEGAAGVLGRLRAAISEAVRASRL